MSHNEISTCSGAENDLASELVDCVYRVCDEIFIYLEHIGFIQKVRAVFDLGNHTEPNLRFLTVIKGNPIPAKYKKDSLVLEFDEEYLLFHNTGEKIPKDEILNTQDRKREIDWLNIFDGSVDLKRKEILIKLENNYGFSQATCDRYLKDAIDDGSLIRKKQGIYSSLTLLTIALNSSHLAEGILVPLFVGPVYLSLVRNSRMSTPFSPLYSVNFTTTSVVSDFLNLPYSTSSTMVNNPQYLFINSQYLNIF